jgi:RNA polymerase sigma factor (sigma-70 family)
MHDPTVSHLVDHLFRQQAGQIVATLTRIFGPEHLDLAEDVVQDTLLKALRNWSYRGIPENPGGWIMQVARNQALDHLRREARLRSRREEIARLQASAEQAAPEEADEHRLRDDQLGMIFTCCHPDIPREARVALTLKTLCGFGVPEIARAFLTRDSTIAQRLVRAKRAIREQDVVFEVPSPEALPARLDTVLEVLYLLFNEGYSASRGDDLIRHELCAEAIRLTTILACHPAADLPPVHALLALMLLQASRLPARTDAGGALLLLEEQRRDLWDRSLIERGLAELLRSAAGDDLSIYHLQAGIAACHAVAPSYDATDWPRILANYDSLADISPSPVVALNRAVALSMVHGPAAGLAELMRVQELPAMASYHLFHATLGAILQRMDNPEAAVRHYRDALALTENGAERRFLARKLAECSPSQ